MAGGPRCGTRRASREAVAEAMRVEGDHVAERLRSPNAMEAFQAFLTRRPPDFSRSNSRRIPDLGLWAEYITQLDDEALMKPHDIWVHESTWADPARFCLEARLE